MKNDRATGMPRAAVLGFTLVELLVVIGIIAILIGILLPTLSRAREAGNTIKCASNLRSVAQGMAIYLAENKGTFPAAYGYVGTTLNGQVGTATVQTPDKAIMGYVHWSSYLYRKGGPTSTDSNGAVPMTPANSIYHNTTGWDIFTCPSFNNGGLAPANTFSGNLDPGQANDPSTGGQYVDQQAPRMAYTVNEAIMGRNKYVLGMDDNGRPVTRTYRFVRAGQVAHSAETVLATEFNQNWRLVTDDGGNATTAVPCKSHRPVHGFYSTDSLDIDTVNAPISLGGAGRYSVSRCKPSDLTPNLMPGGSSTSRLDFVGRNHGRGKDSKGRSRAKSNFLYVDGHAETKLVEETLSPRFEWGDQFYSLKQNGDIYNAQRP